MLRINRAILCIGLAAFTAAGSSVVAAPAYNCIESIHTVKAGTATFVDFELTGRTFATLATAGNRVRITFANTRPGMDLAQNLRLDESLGRMNITGHTGDSNSTEVTIDLSGDMSASLVKAQGSNEIRLCLEPASESNTAVVSMVGSNVETMQGTPVAGGSIDTLRTTPVAARPVLASPSGSGLYDLDAYNSDAASLFKSLAVQSKADIVLVGNIANKVTIHFTQTPIDRAIDLLAKAAGLAYIQDGGAFIIGSDKDLSTAYPNTPLRYSTDQKVYVCKYVDAGTLATSLNAVFDKTVLHIAIGAQERSTSFQGGTMASGLDNAASGGSGSSSTTSTSGSSTGSSSSTGGLGSSASSSSNSGGHDSREVILSGEAQAVEQAYALAQQLDRRRKQIKIDVEITDVTLGDLKQLGIQWAFPQFNVQESKPSGFSFGSFQRSPLNFQATMTALEDANKAKLLAAPSIALLDGEQGYILIGQRVSYPLLTGYSQAQTPIFSVGQEEVGIYLQVQCEMTGDDEIMLSVYPQVSSITGYLNVNGASYPQVSTREQQTTIRVHSGGKVIIGGLINDQDTKDFQSVPLLSQIPLFGELFKYRNNNKSRDEVIMTITPTVVED